MSGKALPGCAREHASESSRKRSGTWRERVQSTRWKRTRTRSGTRGRSRLGNGPGHPWETGQNRCGRRTRTRARSRAGNGPDHVRETDQGTSGKAPATWGAFAKRSARRCREAFAQARDRAIPGWFSTTLERLEHNSKCRARVQNVALDAFLVKYGLCDASILSRSPKARHWDAPGPFRRANAGREFREVRRFLSCPAVF
jgi:hypothetical protein